MDLLGVWMVLNFISFARLKVRLKNTIMIIKRDQSLTLELFYTKINLVDILMDQQLTMKEIYGGQSFQEKN